MRQEDDQWKGIARFLIAFCAGIIGHRFLVALIPFDVYFILSAMLIVVAFAIRGSKRTPIWGLLLGSPLGVLTGVLMGMGWANVWATNLIAKTVPVAIEQQDVTVTGRVVGLPVESNHYVRFDFLIDTLIHEGVKYPSPGKVRLKNYNDELSFEIGQVWQMTVRLKRARGYQNPGSGFNYETYLFEQRIRGTGYIRSKPPAVLLAVNQGSVIGTFRERVLKFVQARFGADPHVGILTALLVGVKSGMGDEHWSVLINTGTIHLVAISGLHVGLVFSLVAWIATRIGSVFLLIFAVPAGRVGVIVGFSAALFYALLAGMTIPTRRALAMLAVVVIAMLSNRRLTSGETMLLVLSFVLFIDPLSALSNGFWLSFSAVCAILLCLNGLRASRANQMQQSVVRKIYQMVVIQIGIFVGMMPLLLILFHQVSMVAPLANLIAVPVIGLLVVPVALVGLLFFSFGLPELSVHFFDIALWVLEWIWPFLSWLSSLSGALMQIAHKPLILLVCPLIGVIFWFLPKAFFPRWLGVLWFVPVFFGQAPKLNEREFRYTMLEIGHGLASVIETRNHVLVYDTGPGSSLGLNAGKTTVNPYLISRGVSKIDKIILSHDHNDHVGGYVSVADAFKVESTLVGVPAFMPSAVPCDAGDEWHWDGVRFELLWPKKHHHHDANNASCVLKVSSNFGSILLTGDIEKEAELRLVEKFGEYLKSDVLQIPHQGSKTSSTQSFLDAVDPRYGLVSTGYLNKFRHPHEVVINRYKDKNIMVLNTAHQGGLTVEFKQTLTVQGHRESLLGYWFL